MRAGSRLSHLLCPRSVFISIFHSQLIYYLKRERIAISKFLETLHFSLSCFRSFDCIEANITNDKACRLNYTRITQLFGFFIECVERVHPNSQRDTVALSLSLIQPTDQFVGSLYQKAPDIYKS